MDVNGKVIIVTGASGGIGEAAARLLAQRGAQVVLAARSEEKLKKLESELPGSLAVVADVSRGEDIERLVSLAIERFGRVDVLVNNAGQGLHVPVEKIKLDDFRAIMELNVFGPLLLTQAVLPHMRRAGQGTILNISSGTTKMILPGVGAYASTKAALNMLSQVARAELAADNIDVILLYPYITLTEFHQNLRDSAPNDGQRRGSMPPGHTAEFVAAYILRCIQTGEDEIVLRPGTPPAEI